MNGNKNKRKDGVTISQLNETRNKLSNSEKLRKKIEKELRKKGIDITIDPMGIGHLYTPLYVAKINREVKL